MALSTALSEREELRREHVFDRDRYDPTAAVDDLDVVPAFHLSDGANYADRFREWVLGITVKTEPQ